MGFISRWRARRAAKKSPSVKKLTSAQQSAQQSLISTAQQKSQDPSQSTSLTKIATSTSTSGGGSGGGGSSTLSTPTSAATSTSTQQTSSATLGITPPKSTVVTQAAKTRASQQKAIIAEATNQTSTRTFGTVQPTPQATRFIPKLKQRISDRRARIATEESRDKGKKPIEGFKRQATGIGLGVAASAISTFEFITTPIKSTKQIFISGKELFTNPMVRQTAREGLTTAIRTEPGFFAGFVGGEVLTAKGAGALVKAGKSAKIAGVPTEFVGVTAPVGETSKTFLGFRLASGEKGFATAITKLDDGGVSKTIVGGRYGKTGFSFPSGKEVVKGTKTFGTREFSKSDNINAFLKTETDSFKFAEDLIRFNPKKELSIGSTITTRSKTIAEGLKTGKTDLNPFALQGITLKENSISKVFTDVITKDKKIREVKGTIISKEGGVGTMGSSLGTKTVSGLSDQALKDISSSIGSLESTKTITKTPSFIPKPTVPPIKPTPISSVAINTQTFKGITPQATKEIVKTTQVIKLDTKVSSSGKSSTRPKPVVIQSVSQIQSPAAKSIQKTITNERVKTQQGISIATAQAQQQRQVLKTIGQQKIGVRFPVPSIKPKIVKPIFSRRTKRITTGTGRFGVQVRRGGIFRSVGSGLSLKEAKLLGQQRVGGTLAATYRVTGKGAKRLRTPKGFYSKAGKEGVLFIEKRSKRLSKKTETQEIQIAKRRKKKKKPSTKKKK